MSWSECAYVYIDVWVFFWGVLDGESQILLNKKKMEKARKEGWPCPRCSLWIWQDLLVITN